MSNANMVSVFAIVITSFVAGMNFVEGHYFWLVAELFLAAVNWFILDMSVGQSYRRARLEGGIEAYDNVNAKLEEMVKKTDDKTQ